MIPPQVSYVFNEENNSKGLRPKTPLRKDFQTTSTIILELKKTKKWAQSNATIGLWTILFYCILVPYYI